MKIQIKKTVKFTMVALCLGLVGFCLSTVSCDKPINGMNNEDEGDTTQITTPVKICDVDNPLTDLPWLKEIVDNALFGRIYQCTYEDTVGFFFFFYKFSTYSLKNCEGITVCYVRDIGGSHGGCSGANIDFNSRKLIWVNPIVCHFDNPLTDLPWLKEFTDTYPTLYTKTVRIYQCNYIDGIGFLIDYVDSDYSILKDCQCRTEYDSRYSKGKECEELNIDFENKVLIWEYIND
jgi:hypothetical protein